MAEIMLKPCPFCGKKVEFFVIDSKTYDGGKAAEWRFSIHCTNCGVKNPHMYRLDAVLDKNAEFQLLLDERRVAADDWNRRVDL